MPIFRREPIRPEFVTPPQDIVRQARELEPTTEAQLIEAQARLDLVEDLLRGCAHRGERGETRDGLLELRQVVNPAPVVVRPAVPVIPGRTS